MCALAAHPEDHPGQHADREQRDDPLEDLFGVPLELRTDGEDRDPHHDEIAIAEPGAPPDDLRPVLPAELVGTRAGSRR